MLHGRHSLFPTGKVYVEKEEQSVSERDKVCFRQKNVHKHFPYLSVLKKRPQKAWEGGMPIQALSIGATTVCNVVFFANLPSEANDCARFATRRRMYDSNEIPIHGVNCKRPVVLACDLC